MRSFSLGICGDTCLSGKLRYCRLNPGKPFTGKLMAKPYRQGIAADSDAIGHLPIAKTRVGNLPSDFLVSHSYPPFVVVVVDIHCTRWYIKCTEQQIIDKIF